MSKQTVILLASVYIVYAAVTLQQPLEPKPKKFENIEGCYVKELDTVIPFGKSTPSNSSCVQYNCEKTMLELMTCGPSAGLCYIVEDMSKPYPDCCPQIMCD